MEIHENTFVLTKAEIRALVTFASSDKSRVNFYIVWFDVGAGWAESTDGHRALRAHAEVVLAPCISHPPVAISSENLISLQKMGGPKSEIRINLDAKQGEVWEMGGLLSTLPFKKSFARRPAFDAIGFDKPLRANGIPVWYANVLLLKMLDIACKGWEAATGQVSQQKVVQIETPTSELDSLRCTFGKPGEPHCWQAILMTVSRR